MKENRLYFRKTTNVKRIIRVFEEHGDNISTQQIMDFLFDQKSKKGTRYLKQPKRGTVAQLLNKYPFFERIGTTKEKSLTNNKMAVALWKLNDEEERV